MTKQLRGWHIGQTPREWITLRDWLDANGYSRQSHETLEQWRERTGPVSYFYAQLVEVAEQTIAVNSIEDALRETRKLFDAVYAYQCDLPDGDNTVPALDRATGLIDDAISELRAAVDRGGE